MSEENSIQVNFGKPMPLFPLDLSTLLPILPQQVLPLHIFEPRYRQMIEHALDGAGQIAMAIFKGPGWKKNYHGKPALRPAVCITQIVQHEKLPDGRYNLLVQGVCRAKILKETPADKERLYRTAMLEPVGVMLSGAPDALEHVEDEAPEAGEAGSEPALDIARARIADMLDTGPLRQMMHAAAVLEYVRNDELPTSAVLELVAFTLITDPRLRYDLLAEPQAQDRARIIMSELTHLASLIRRASDQKPGDWPKGCSWN